MKLHNKQREVVKSNRRFKVIRAGRRGGKSTLEVEVCSFKAITKNEQFILYLAPTQKQARSIIWEEFKKRLTPVGAKFNESRLEIKVPTTSGGFSIIYIGGWENRENYRGMKFHHIVFDELDTLRDFFLSWQEIFRPALTDTEGTADFIGTPKAESRNLARMEKVDDSDYASFHFTSYDNPFVLDSEIDKAKKEIDPNTFAQEYMAQYVENEGALFNFTSLVDTFSNSIEKSIDKYMIVDIADDGSDKTIFSLWEGLEEYQRERYSRLNTEMIIEKIRELAQQEKIPYSNIAVDAIGVGAGVSSNSQLDGIIGFKSSFAPIKTDNNIINLNNKAIVGGKPLVSDYKNLRSQCVFTLAGLVNTHKLASRLEGRDKEVIIEELSYYTDASKGDGKRMALGKEDVKEMLGHSPDDSDTWIMRMYFVLKGQVIPEMSNPQQTLRIMQNRRRNRSMA